MFLADYSNKSYIETCGIVLVIRKTHRMYRAKDGTGGGGGGGGGGVSCHLACVSMAVVIRKVVGDMQLLACQVGLVGIQLVQYAVAAPCEEVYS